MMSNRIAIKGEIDAVLVTDVVKKLLDFSEQYPSENITIYVSSKGVGGIATLILAAGTPGMRCAYEGTKIGFGSFYAEQNDQPILQTIVSAMQKIYHAMVFGIIDKVIG